MSSKALEELLMTEAGVSCLSGSAFGQYGDGYCDSATPTRSRTSKRPWAGFDASSTRWAEKRLPDVGAVFRPPFSGIRLAAATITRRGWPKAV
jgi:hypothetical protein